MIQGKAKLTGGNGDFETIPEGVYTLQIIDVNEAILSFKGKERGGFNFKFAILDDEEFPVSGEPIRGRFLWWKVSDSINKKSNLCKLAVSALGRPLTDEEQDIESDGCLNLNGLVGLQIMAVITNSEDKTGKLWSNIDSVSKVKTLLKPVEYEPEEEVKVKTTTKAVVEKEEVQEGLELVDPVIDKIMNDTADEEEEDVELAELEAAAEKAKERLAKLKESKRLAGK